MALKTTFIVQTCVIKRKRLVPSDREVSPPESSALQMGADDETGELEVPTILGQFGEIPEDLAESLQGT